MKIQEINQADMINPEFLSLQYRAFCKEIDAANRRVAHTEAIADLVSDNRDLRAAFEELVTVLQMLYDEQNDAPTKRRRAQWELATKEAGIALKKYSEYLKK